MTKKFARHTRREVFRLKREAAMLDLDRFDASTEADTEPAPAAQVCEDCGQAAFLLRWSNGRYHCGCGSCSSESARSRELAAVGICPECGDELESDEDVRCMCCAAAAQRAGPGLPAGAVARSAAIAGA